MLKCLLSICECIPIKGQSGCCVTHEGGTSQFASKEPDGHVHEIDKLIVVY